MSEMLTSRILNDIRITMFYLIVFTVLSIVITLLVMVKPNRFLPWPRLYIFLFGVFIIGIIVIMPIMKMTISLFKDYNQQTINVKEGLISNSYIRNKLLYIEIDNEKFIISPNLERVKVGQPCNIKYFKHSKYIYELEINEDINKGVK